MSLIQSLKKKLPAKMHSKSAERASAGTRESNTKAPSGEDRWFQSDAKLPIDLHKRGSELVLTATIAGVEAEHLEITIQGDIITIKGVRAEPEDNGEEADAYYHQECYWGPFSRQIILPEEIDPSRADASLENGILTIRVPCLEREKQRKLEIK